MRKWRLLVLLRELVYSFFPGRHESRFKNPFGLGFEGAHSFSFDDDFLSLDLIRYIVSDEDFVVERPATRTARIYLFLDRTPSMMVGWGPRTRFEAGVSVASIFIAGLADEGNQIGIGLFTDRVEFTPRLKTGLRALRSELENALEKRCSGTLTNFEALREYLFNDVPAGSLVFVISDWESPTINSGTVESMDDRFELIPVVMLHRGEEGEGSFMSDIAVTDPETGETVVCGKIENDHRYREAFDKAGVLPIELFIEDGEESWETSIQEYFEERKKVKRIQRRKQ